MTEKAAAAALIAIPSLLFENDLPKNKLEAALFFCWPHLILYGLPLALSCISLKSLKFGERKKKKESEVMIKLIFCLVAEKVKRKKKSGKRKKRT